MTDNSTKSYYCDVIVDDAMKFADVQISPDGALATINWTSKRGLTRRMDLYDISKNKFVLLEKGKETSSINEWHRNCCFSPDSKKLYYAAGSCVVVIDIAARQSRHLNFNVTDSFHISDDGNYLIENNFRDAKVYNIETSALVTQTHNIFNMSLVVGTNVDKAYFYDAYQIIDAWSPMHAMQLPPEKDGCGVWHATLSASGDSMYMADHQGNRLRINLCTGTIADMKIDSQTYSKCARFLPKFGVMEITDRGIIVWDSEVTTYGTPDRCMEINGGAISADCKRAITSSSNHVHLVDLANLKSIQHTK
jgi:hypothetical protein